MIEFNYETDFKLDDEAQYRSWIVNVIESESKAAGCISYIFCADEYLLEINQKHLDHDMLTDIISFDYSVGNELNGDIFISVDRIRENAAEFDVPFDEELRRVMAHGLLHYSGYEDKTDEGSEMMRSKEEEKMNLFHVEH